MRAGEPTSGAAAARGRTGMELWMIPTAALLAMVLATWLLKPAIENVLQSDLVHQWDTMLLAWFRSRATPTLDSAVQAFTLLGSPFAMLVYAFLGLTMLLNRRKWLLLISWDVLFVGMFVLTKTIKPFFHRPRPPGAQQFLSGMSDSFPSTHALSAMAAFGMIAFVITQTTELERESRSVLWLFTAVLIVAIGMSRLYLGVHYLSDVAAGVLIGGVWLAVCLWAYHRAQGKLQQLASAPSTKR